MADICSSLFKNIPACVSPEASISQLGQLTLSSRKLSQRHPRLEGASSGSRTAMQCNRKEFSYACVCVYQGRNPDKNPNVKNNVNPGGQTEETRGELRVLSQSPDFQTLTKQETGWRLLSLAGVKTDVLGRMGLTLPEDWVKDTRKTEPILFPCL